MEVEKIRSQTLPIEIEHNQVYTEMRVKLPDRQTHMIRCWLNPNSNTFILTEAIAHQLHISYDEPFQREEGLFATFTSPQFCVGHMPLSLQHTHTQIAVGKTLIAPSIPAFGVINKEALLPYQIRIDYQNKKLTLVNPKYTSEPYLFSNSGRIPITFDPQMKVAQTDVVVEDQTYKVILDIGASHTYFSREVLDDWALRYPH